MRRRTELSAFGLRVKTEMMRQNLCVRDIAKAIGKSDSTVCEVISGKNRSKTTRKQILDVLDIEEEELPGDPF